MDSRSESFRRKGGLNMSDQVQKVQTNGVETAYRFDGPEKGPVVLMSNSLMSNHRMWDWTIPALTDKYRVLRYDMRGHGATGTTPPPYNMAQLADDAVALLDALKIDKVHFVGLSMGGMIGQQLGARYANRVHSLTLCNTGSEMAPRHLWDDRLAMAREKGMAVLVEPTLQRWFTAGFLKSAPQDIDKIKAMVQGTGLEGYTGCASAVRDMAQSVMLLKIKTPTLIIAGKQDPATTVDHATVLNRLIDGSKLVVLDAAHLSNVEQPQAFNRAMRDFIDSVDKTL
jgi:3-oxoadipate enol-lactonase